MSELVEQLKLLLTRPFAPLAAAEITLIFSTFSANSTNKSLSLAVLSRSLSPSVPAAILAQTSAELTKSILDLLNSKNEEIEIGLRVLKGILQVAIQTGLQLFKSIELKKKLEKVIQLESLREASLELLVELASQSETRSLVRSFRSWLEGLLGDKAQKIEILEEKDDQIRERALAAIAVVKLVLGRDIEDEGIAKVEKTEAGQWEAKDLIILFKEMIIKRCQNKEDMVILIALEGLAYLTLVPSTNLKSLLMEKDFLVALFSIIKIEYEVNNPLEYALASVLVNLVSYPKMEESGSEAEQLNRLKSFAATKDNKKGEMEKESIETVNARIETILKTTPSILPILVKLSRSSAISIRRSAGTLWLHLAQQSSIRPRLLQAGAAKSLLRMIEKIGIVEENGMKGIEATDINSIQALAKLLITNNPEIVLSTEEIKLNALNALLLPLILPILNSNPSQSLLIKFESMMALTNLSSLERGGFPDRLANLTLPPTSSSPTAEKKEPVKFLTILQDLVLHDNLLIRRAATELLCNLVSTQSGHQFYAPTPKISKNLKLFIALIASEDLSTRLAASGAVAILASDSKLIALSILEDEKRNLEIILELLENEAGVGLWLRGLTIIISILAAVEQSDKKVELSKLLVDEKIKEGILGCDDTIGDVKELKKQCIEILKRLE